MTCAKASRDMLLRVKTKIATREVCLCLLNSADDRERGRDRIVFGVKIHSNSRALMSTTRWILVVVLVVVGDKGR